MKLLVLLERVFGVSRKENGDYYSFYSPFVTHRKPKLSINISNQKWKCWVSEKSGKGIYKLFKESNIKEQSYYKELKEILETQKIVTSTGFKPYNFNSQTVTKSKHITLPENFKKLLPLDKNNIMHIRYYNYVKNRGLSDIDIIDYNIGFIMNGKYNDTIIIPSYDKDYNFNYWYGKSIYGIHYLPKSQDVKKTDIVFFESRINWDFPLTIVEGVFDAITLKRNVIPLIGKEISNNLIKNIYLNGCRQVNLILDSDVNYENLYQIKERFKRLSINCEMYRLGGKDANELGYIKSVETMKHLESSFEEYIKHKLNK
jgi:hypothetical protein